MVEFVGSQYRLENRQLPLICTIGSTLIKAYANSVDCSGLGLDCMTYRSEEKLRLAVETFEHFSLLV